MPTLEHVAGQQTINFTGEEYLRQTLGDPRATADFDQMVASIGPIKSPNDMPVKTFGNEFVIPYGGVFTDREIEVALELGHIVCDPAPNPEHGARLNGTSIDVTLGHYFYTAGKHDNKSLFNPFSIKDNLDYFSATGDGGGFKELKPWADVRAKLSKEAIGAAQEFIDLNKIDGIPEDHPILLLRPNERVLAHTHEFIGVRSPGTTSMQARSTTGRIGLSACYCAGWGDPGYINRWTMEIHNLNENDFLPVPVGLRMAQIVFSSTGPVGTEYSRASGNYQDFESVDLAAIKKAWRPYMMLPRAYNSEIVMPTDVFGLGEGIR